MPVLPDDGSRRIWPGCRLPSFSACSTIVSAMRSFTEPPGFWPSSFTSSRTRGLGLSWVISTSGVSPMRSSTDRYWATVPVPVALAAGDGRQDRDDVGLGDLGVELVEVADVVVVHVNVHELVQRAVVGPQLAPQPWIAGPQILEHLGAGAPPGT